MTVGGWNAGVSWRQGCGWRRLQVARYGGVGGRGVRRWWRQSLWVASSRRDDDDDDGGLAFEGEAAPVATTRSGGSAGDSVRKSSAGDSVQMSCAGDSARISCTGDSARICYAGNSARLFCPGGSAPVVLFEWACSGGFDSVTFRLLPGFFRPDLCL